MICARCGRRLEVASPSRRDTCAGCGVDLRACVQCAFYSPGRYNDCREPRADRVVDKERSNFCEWFRPAEGRPPGKGDEGDVKAQVRAQLEALFKKRS